MTSWRMRALFGASAAALLVAVVPFGSGAVHELGVLKRVAEERVALLSAAKLSTETLPRNRNPRAEGAASEAVSPSQAPPEFDTAPLVNIELPAPPAAPAPDAAPSGGPKPVPVSPAAQAYRKGDAAALSALAKAASDPDERLALEWAALRTDPNPLGNGSRRLCRALTRTGRATPISAPGRRATFSPAPFCRRRSSRFSPQTRRSRPPAGWRSRAPRAPPAMWRTRSGRFVNCGATAISTPGPKASSCANSARPAQGGSQISRRPAALCRKLRACDTRRSAGRRRRDGAGAGAHRRRARAAQPGAPEGRSAFAQE